MVVLDVELPELLICLINRLTEPGRTESLRADPRLSSAGCAFTSTSLCCASPSTIQSYSHLSEWNFNEVYLEASAQGRARQLCAQSTVKCSFISRIKGAFTPASLLSFPAPINTNETEQSRTERGTRQPKWRIAKKLNKYGKGGKAAAICSKDK